MKHIVRLFLWIFLFAPNAQAGGYSFLWQETQATLPSEPVRHVHAYKVFLLQQHYMRSILETASDHPTEAVVIDLPVPDGSFRAFRIWQTPVMEPALGAKYPQIRTFTAVALDDAAVTAKIESTPEGFHAMIYSGANTWFIDPYADDLQDHYQVYYRRHAFRSDVDYMSCYVGDLTPVNAVPVTVPDLQELVHGHVKRTYRLALACTGEYAVAVAGSNPTKAVVLGRMVVTINRVNGLYERELAVSMQLVAQTDDLIFLNSSTDPYSNNDGYALMSQNQTQTDMRIGSGGYDIGHVFSTGGGGIAQKGSVCDDDRKAMGVTGAQNPQGDAFDIDYVAHEIGHQFGADHTFNATSAACGGGNRVAASAYEPGSGSTVMGYAGLCGADNLQPHGDIYFHARTLQQIAQFVGAAGNCATNANLGHTPPVVEGFSSTFVIPFLTPFELTAPAATGNMYCWEEWDLSTTEFSWTQSRLTAPLFRSFTPDASPVRVFPALTQLVNNTISYTGEKLPEAARSMRFRLTVRSVSNGIGSFNFAEDSVLLRVHQTAAPFRVTIPNAGSISWRGGTTETITWDVGGSDLSPVNCTHVDVFLSVDGGLTYPVPVASGLPNTGVAVITVPNVRTTTTARIKIKAQGNVFFDISNEDFRIEHDRSLPYPYSVASAQPPQPTVQIFPVPAGTVLYVSADESTPLQTVVYNAQGQTIWSGLLEGDLALPVSSWSRGVYYFRFASTNGAMPVTERVVLQ